MEKKVAKILIAVAIVVLIIIYYFPKPLDEVVIPNVEITIIRNAILVENGFPEQNVTTYQFLPDEKSYGRVKDIFSKYTYHRNLRSLFVTTGLDTFKDNVYTIYFNNDIMKYMEFRGSGEIVINNHSYSMKVSEQTALMDEIESLLSTETPISQS